MTNCGDMSPVYGKRIERIGKQLKRKKIDVFLVMTEINRFYLTGFRSSNGVLVIRAGGGVDFYTDFRYLEMARKGIDVARVRSLGDFTSQFSALAKKEKWRRVGFEGKISTTQFESIRQAMSDVEEWVQTQQLICAMRSIKNRSEQAAIRKAVRITDAAYARTLEETEVGMTEREMMQVLRKWYAEYDAEKEAFDAIVSFGANSSKPHAKVQRKPLRRGQPILVDTGAVFDGYCSDMTRTVFAQKASAKMREVYEIVRTAQQKAVDAVCAGARPCDVDAAARNYIDKKGYGRYFGHGLGHGVGLEVHESPSLNQKTEEPLRGGMVVTIEPGVYLPGVGGVRIEDTVIVKRDGCEVLTGTPKELRFI